MITYKLDIAKQFAKFQHRLYPASAPAPELQGNYETIQEVIEAVDKELNGTLQQGDTVIFRGVAQHSRGELRRLIRDAPY